MSSRNPKLALFAHFAAVARSLAHAHRLELLEQLAQGERSVEVLADRTRLSIANASQHLQQMRHAGLVASRREVNSFTTGLLDDSILDLLGALRRIAERNVAEVERVIRSYFHNRDSLEPISREELLQRSRGGEVIVRPMSSPHAWRFRARGHDWNESNDDQSGACQRARIIAPQPCIR
jgi:ArsR family transcriptional regulator